MYESHFGFTGAPFGLNPDPSFFFGSRGHSNALSYLKFGVYQGEGFVVVTGEIGAGKTTLVRTLLSELNADEIVASQVVSTQLQADDLLQAVALSFGIAPKNLSKAELLAAIEAFLTFLVTKRKRALLIVDEAQNLKREAVEELRMLSNFQLGNRALLQSFLVGQPELRTLLVSKPMEQLRQRVIASCHLGPMDRAETQAYIEHRLHHVGWQGRPSFDDGAFDKIFEWTAGIPRRVNLLCNRLLLSAFLESRDSIDVEQVQRCGDEARAEVGDAPAPEPEPQPIPAPGAPVIVREPAAAESLAVAHPAPKRSDRRRAAHADGPLLCVACTPTEDVEMAALLCALQAHPSAPPLLHVRIGPNDDFVPNDSFFERLELDVPVLHLGIAEATATQQMAVVLQRFAPIIDKHRPAAIIVAGNSDSALACSLAAVKKDTRLVHAGAGVRGRDDLNGHRGPNDLLIDRLADAFYAWENAAYLNLIREGVEESRVQLVGPLLLDATRLAQTEAIASATELQLTGAGARDADDAEGYGVVALERTFLHGDRNSAIALISSLHELAREAALVWPMPAAVDAKLKAMDLREQAEQDRVSVIPAVSFAQGVELLKRASMVVTDRADVRLQAAGLGVRCLMVDPHHDTDAGSGKSGMPADGQAAQRIAQHLGQWLANGARDVAPMPQ